MERAQESPQHQQDPSTCPQREWQMNVALPPPVGDADSQPVNQGVRPERIVRIGGFVFRNGTLPDYPSTLDGLIERKVREQTAGLKSPETRDMVAAAIRAERSGW